MSNILIIDDDPEFRGNCRRLLEAAGFEVREAGDPESGFQKVKEDPPDLLILDVLMPSDYEGFEVARRIRGELDLKDMPILMLSAVHDVKQKPYRFTPDEVYLPIDSFIDKPVLPSTLVRKVREMLKIHREEPEQPL